MGSGSRAYREALGEAKAIQEHQLAMIPIVREQTEMQLEMQEKAFGQELEQKKELSLLAQQLQPGPIFVPAAAMAKPPGSKYLIYAGLAGLAYFFFR